MSKKDKDKPPPRPVAKPKGGEGKRCSTCGSLVREHTVKQLVDCLAQQN